MFNRKTFRVIILSFFFLTSVPLFAEVNPLYSFGLHGGYSFVFLKHTEGTALYDWDMSSAYTGGISFERNFNNFLSFKSGFDYSYFLINGSSKTDTSNVKLEFQTIRVPFNFNLIYNSKYVAVIIPLGASYINIFKSDAERTSPYNDDGDFIYFNQTNQFGAFSGLELRFHTFESADFFIYAEAEYLFRQLIDLPTSDSKDNLWSITLKSGFVFRTF